MINFQIPIPRSWKNYTSYTQTSVALKAKVIGRYNVLSSEISQWVTAPFIDETFIENWEFAPFEKLNRSTTFTVTGVQFEIKASFYDTWETYYGIRMINGIMLYYNGTTWSRCFDADTGTVRIPNYRVLRNVILNTKDSIFRNWFYVNGRHGTYNATIRVFDIEQSTEPIFEAKDIENGRFVVTSDAIARVNGEVIYSGLGDKAICTSSNSVANFLVNPGFFFTGSKDFYITGDAKIVNNRFKIKSSQYLSRHAGYYPGNFRLVRNYHTPNESVEEYASLVVKDLNNFGLSKTAFSSSPIDTYICQNGTLIDGNTVVDVFAKFLNENGFLSAWELSTEIINPFHVNCGNLDIQYPKGNAKNITLHTKETHLEDDVEILIRGIGAIWGASNPEQEIVNSKIVLNCANKSLDKDTYIGFSSPTIGTPTIDKNGDTLNIDIPDGYGYTKEDCEYIEIFVNDMSIGTVDVNSWGYIDENFGQLQ